MMQIADRCPVHRTLSGDIRIVTEKGACDRAYRYPVRISNGSVGYAGEASFNVSGRVGPNGAVQAMIFDGGKQVLYIVDPARKTYMEMTKADADRLGAQVQGAMAQMQAQLEKLPPAQRAQMEAMLKGRGGAAAVPQ